MGLENPVHIAVLALVLLLFFGARRIPELGRSLGGGIREFAAGISGDRREVDDSPASSSATQQPIATPAERVSDHSTRFE